MAAPKKPRPDNPYYVKPSNPSYTRRARHHDYTRPAHYMITLKKSDQIPILSIVSGNPGIVSGNQSIVSSNQGSQNQTATPTPATPNNETDGKLAPENQNVQETPKAIPTATGRIFIEAIKLWLNNFPQIKIPALVIMPDHIHFCLSVTEKLPSGLSRAIALLMGKTTTLYSAKQNQTVKYAEKQNQTVKHAAEQNQTVKFFKKGFTDSIAYTPEQFSVQIQYILDNPRRLLMKRLHPDLYFKRWIITHNDISIMAIGNIYLLKYPHLQVVRFSRKFSPEQLEANRRAWELCTENGGVLISPFIHPKEKEMMRWASENGGRYIRIVNNGFSERFSPTKAEFDLLGQGRLLLIAPTEYNSEKQDLHYAYAQKLNSLAMLLSTHPSGMRIKAAKPPKP